MSDRWQVAFARSADKEVDRLDPPVRRRILKALRGVADDPRSASLRKLRGRPEWRLRVGDWRVLVELEEGTRTIVVKHVLPRGRAYDR